MIVGGNKERCGWQLAAVTDLAGTDRLWLFTLFLTHEL